MQYPPASLDALLQKLDPNPYGYAVDYDVPLPQKKMTGGRKSGAVSRLNLPWPIMSVGGSVFVPAADWTSLAAAPLAIAQAIQTRSRNHPPEQYVWRTRTLTEHGEEGWRIWRTR